MHSFHRVFALIGVTLWLAACTLLPTAPTTTPTTLTYVLPQAPTTLDPARATDRASLDISGLLYEGLTGYDPQTATVVPALAEAWDVSGNGLTYTFKLRAGVRWVNQAGEIRREVTAEDVVFAIQRACDPATLAPHAATLSVIRGCTPLASSAGEVQVRALDPYIVEFVLATPAAYFPLLMSLPVAHPLPAEIVNGTSLLWNDPATFLTNSAYLMQESGEDGSLIFTRNPHHYAIDSLPFTTITMPLLSSTTITDYKGGLVDTMPLAVQEMTEVPAAEQYGELEDCTYGLGFTLIKPPLDTYRVRLALSLAIDRETLIEEHLNGMAVAARTFTPPGVVGGPTAATAGVSFQAERARELMAQAGYTDGVGFPEISLMVPDTQLALADGIATTWRETLGISVTVQSQPFEQYVQTIATNTPLVEMPHVWGLGWCAQFPDAYAWSHAAFDVQNPPTALNPDVNPAYASRVTLRPGTNAARRIPTRFDELTEQAIGERDAEARQALYVEAEDLLLTQEVVVAPVYHYMIPVAAKPWLSRTYYAYGEQPFALWRIDARQRNLVLTPETE